MTTTTTDAFLRALAHSKSVETQTLLLDEMLRSLISETENSSSSLDDDEDEDEDRALFLDLRPREKYQKHSLSRSVNIPFDEISGSFHLLPPRETPFSVFLEEGRDDEEESLVSSSKSFENQRETFQRGDFKGVQWNIKYVFVYNEHFINAVNAKMLKMQKDSSLGNGVETHDVLALNNEKKKNTRRRLWEPSPSVKELYKTFLSSSETNSSIVLDLGSGVGRDSVYLASKGFDVLACDFDQRALTRTQEMARLHGVEDKVKVLKWDARNDDAFMCALSSVDDLSRLKLVLGVRFCHKPLFGQIVKHMPAESDCFFAWFHFAKGCEHSKVGRPNKEKDLIAPNEELRSIFTKNEGFEVLKDDVSFISDGRPSANFIARR